MHWWLYWTHNVFSMHSGFCIYHNKLLCYYKYDVLVCRNSSNNLKFATRLQFPTIRMPNWHVLRSGTYGNNQCHMFSM